MVLEKKLCSLHSLPSSDKGKHIRNVDYVNESFCEGEAVPRIGIFHCSVTLGKHMLFGTRLVFVSNAWLPRHLQTSSEKRCV